MGRRIWLAGLRVYLMVVPTRKRKESDR
ncbi:hypothetical protein HU200_014825 [Digitaria exilis]|uniref:Uncharacterized protein n=1 Tax=Digitaria exilis TaxID=1010633 RepID=A0A835FAV2_9POAL|nr:hypothetical protein HU200_014825 [Digitaria exilis]